ncbi:MAG TPA: tyrosine-type recombinase/integrase [Thermoanaerobaculia bacterium]|nr:tyrosine-type recombinase/integrase [Thermoanaerobaculia bacterium]
MNVRGTAVIEAPPAPIEEAPKTTIAEASKLFLYEAVSRNLAESSLRIYRRFIGRQLPAWFADRGWLHVEDITFERLAKLKSGCTFKAATAAKRLELLKQFLGFCVSADWLAKNYAESFKSPEVNEPPTLPYTDEEMERILRACEAYSHHGDHGHNRPARIKTFVLLLRYSGLRIQDAACLETEKLHGDDLMLRTGKTGQAVFVPLPPDVAEGLRHQAGKNSNPKYFFWSGNGKQLSAVSSWQRTLRKVLKDAKVSKGENMMVAHRFRDTLATSLLANGVPIEDVAAILGNSVKIVEKHYSAWVQARQVRLTERVRATWPKQERKLKAVS